MVSHTQSLIDQLLERPGKPYSQQQSTPRSPLLKQPESVLHLAIMSLDVLRVKKITLFSGLLVVMAIVSLTALLYQPQSPFGKPAYSGKRRSHTRDSETKRQRLQAVIKGDAIDWTPLQTPYRFPKRLKGRGGPILPGEVIANLEKFIFFVGYPRSGHSILGSLLDAHPHVAIAHEFMLFGNWEFFSERQRKSGIANPFFMNRTLLFNVLYRQSYWSARGTRSENQAPKNYTLNVDYPWQGTYDTYLNVIGDKSGGMTSNIYLNSSKAFSRYLRELRQTVKVPLKVIHAVRNPFDQISTNLLYKDHSRLPLLDEHELNLKESTSHGNKGSAILVSSYKSAMKGLQTQGNGTAFADAKYDAQLRLKRSIDKLVVSATAVTKIIDLVGPSNVLEVHNMDLVNEPKATMSKLCSFLEIKCQLDYLQACENKVFKSVSKTRSLLVWPPKLKLKVQEELIETFPFFNRYSFESE